MKMDRSNILWAQLRKNIKITSTQVTHDGKQHLTRDHLCLKKHKPMHNTHFICLDPRLDPCLDPCRYTIKNKCRHPEIFKIIFKNVIKKRQSICHRILFLNHTQSVQELSSGSHKLPTLSLWNLSVEK